jgi:LysR family transcriptional regulator, regulator for bpeEF and oprC
MDRLTAMEAFVAVAEMNSFTRAAARMRISTAMMTLHISRLEEHLGVRLFNRTTRRVDLTEDGRHLLGHARAALEAYSAAERALHPGQGLAGRVRLDVPASVGHAFVVPALAEFHKQYPDIVLDLTLGDRGTFFRLDGFDIVLRIGDIPPSGWLSVPLGTTRLVHLASPDYAARHGLPRVAEDLNHHRCIVYASVEAPGGNPWTIALGDKPIRLRPPVAFSFNDGAAIMAAARAGLGIAQNLEMLARRDLEEGTLVPVLPELVSPPMPVVLMGGKDRLALPHVRAVLNFLTERIAWGLQSG